MIKLKRIFGFIAVFIALFSLTNVNAFSTEKEQVYVELGSSLEVELYADLEQETKSLSFLMTYSSKNLRGTDFRPAEGIKQSISGSYHTLNFGEKKSGRVLIGKVLIKTAAINEDTGGTITIKEDGRDSNTNKLNLNKTTLLVHFSEEPEGEENTKQTTSAPSGLYLDAIESNIVNIELKQGVLEYTVTVPADVNELDLKPVVNNPDIKVSTSTQVIDELEEGAITITLEDGKTTQKYTINVKVKKAVREMEIDNTTEVKEYHFRWKYFVVIILSVGAIIALYISKPSKRK